MNTLSLSAIVISSSMRQRFGPLLRMVPVLLLLVLGAVSAEVSGEECTRTFELAEPLFKASGPVSLEYGDIDGDGDIDIMTNADGQLPALNLGNRLFSSTETPRNNSHSTSLLAIHDVNGDGLGDLIYPHALSFGRGGGGFSEPVLWWIEAAKVARFKGEPNLISIRRDSANPYLVYLDRINADGSLSNITQITIAVRFSAENLQIADFDGDGLTDIVFGTPSDSLDNSRIQVAWNLGGLRFSAASSFGLPKHDNIGSADLDGDGAHQIVGLTRGILSVVSFRNREIVAKELQTGLSTRHESGGLQFSRGDGPSFVGFDDRDGDGWKDLVFLGADGFLVLWGAQARPFETSSAFFLPRSWKATLLDLDGDGLSDMVPLRSYPDGPRIVWGTTGTRNLGTPWDLSFESNLSRDMVSRDFNGDGITDLMRTLVPREHQAQSHKSLNWGVEVSLRDEAGGFRSSFVHRSPRRAGWNGQALTADLDRDGNLDLALVTFNYFDGINALTDILLGNGDGTFREPSHQVADLVPVTAGALRADGGDALVMRRDQTLFLMSVDGGVVVLEPIYELSSESRLAGLVVVDQDGDGRDEIVVGYEYQTLILSRTSSGWKASELESEFRGWLLNVHAADFTGDGRSDLLVTNSWGILLFEATATGYTERPKYAPGNHWSMVADLDNDGDQDLLLVGVFDPVATIHLYINDGHGQFQRQDSTDIPDTSYYRESDFLALIDLDGDGYKDLITHYGEILFNRCRQSNMRGTAYPTRIWSGQEATLYFKGSRFLTTARIDRDGVRVGELSGPDNSLFGGFTWRTGPLYTGIHTFDVEATGYDDGRSVSEKTRIVIEVLPAIPRRRTVGR